MVAVRCLRITLLMRGENPEYGIDLAREGYMSS